MSVLDGRAMAAQIREDLKGEVSALRARGVAPALAVVVLGDDPAARAYVRGIERASAAVDVACTVRRLPADAAHEDLARTLDELSADPAVHGIILPTPLPPQIDALRLGAHIAVRKDIDGINPTSAGHLLLGLPSYPPATAAAVMEILGRAAIPLRGRQAVVIGRSAIVGKPVALLLLREDATVTVCHSRTADLPAVARGADVLVVAIGRARHVGADFVKPGATVIDVGINEVDGGIVGDVEYDAVAPIASAITPVPGGVGPLTNVMLLRNTVAAAAEAASRT
jgi:methylenetetrahydrofolate dehydrogenase (NADP+) / methenyltetrahydrofolate cyclohydrolase